MRSFTYGESVILHRRVVRMIAGVPQYDDYGSPIIDATDVTVTGVAVYPSSSVETLQSQDRVATDYTVAFPVAIALDAIDAITWRGERYEVNGHPERYHVNPLTGSAGPAIVAMTRIEG